MGTPAKQIIKIEWSSNFAYAIGLITSDGWLTKEVPRIGFGSREAEMIENFQKALGLHNVIGLHARGGETEKRYFYTAFKSRVFYDFLLEIGLMPAKSKIIQSVDIPDKFFPDFLRGLFDGDGTFYTSWDARWPNSFVFKTSFASASSDFISWLKDRLADLYGVRGYLHKGRGVLNLEYTKRDSKRLFEVMYHSADILFLERKYDKMKTALEFDNSELYTRA
jgi:hypothetical protein